MQKVTMIGEFLCILPYTVLAIGLSPFSAVVTSSPMLSSLNVQRYSPTLIKPRQSTFNVHR